MTRRVSRRRASIAFGAVRLLVTAAGVAAAQDTDTNSLVGFERILSPESTSSNAAALRRAVDRIEVVDDLTVRVHTKGFRDQPVGRGPGSSCAAWPAIASSTRPSTIRTGAAPRSSSG